MDNSIKILLQGHSIIEDTDKKPIELRGNTKESLLVCSSNILYIEALGNYVNVYYEKDNLISSKQIRTTIKQMEDLLSPYPMLVRSHRAFIINIDKITNVAGNALGYKLSIQGLLQEVPVSRTYMQSLESILRKRMV